MTTARRRTAELRPRVAEQRFDSFPEQALADNFRTLQFHGVSPYNVVSSARPCRQRVQVDVRRSTKKARPIGTDCRPRYHPICPPPRRPGASGHSGRTPSCPVASNGQRTRPALTPRRYRVADFSRQLRSDFGRDDCACFHQARLAATLVVRLLVSISAFRKKLYHARLTGSIALASLFVANCHPGTPCGRGPPTDRQLPPAPLPTPPALRTPQTAVARSRHCPAQIPRTRWSSRVSG